MLIFFCFRLLVNLTQPAVLCFNGFIPEVKSLRQSYLDVVSHLQSMKEVSRSPDESAFLKKKILISQTKT